MRLSIMLFAVQCFLLNTALAQQARVKQYKASICGTVNLASVKDPYNAQVFSLQASKPDGISEAYNLEQIKKIVAQKFPRFQQKTAAKTTTVQEPVVTKLYVADSITGIPPDNDMAISKAYKSISVVNSSIAVHNATTGQMTFRKTLKTFSTAVGLNNAFLDSRFDPKVIYDPIEDKFICVMLNSTNDRNWIVIGFTTSNDPTGNWNFYKFYGDYGQDSTWFDYPSIAITKKEFFLTGNKIKYNTSWQAGFKQTVVYQIAKKGGYAGDTALNYQIWENIGYQGKNIRNLYPVKGGDSIYGPEQYFLSNRNFDVQNDTIFLVKIPDTIGSGNSLLTVVPLVSNLQYGVPPQGKQPDTSVELATNDARVLGAIRVGNEIQFTSTTVHPLNGNSAVLHGIISDFATSPTLQTNYITNDTLDFGYPNLSYAGTVAGQHHAIISFNYTGLNKFPGIGAVFFDGSQYSSMLDVKQGTGSINQLTGKSQRWGDYKGSQPDWSITPGVVWIEGIYGRADKRYGNYIARLRSPFLLGIEEASPSVDQAVVFPNPAYELVQVKFSIPQANNLEFFIQDINGSKSTSILKQRCKQGDNLIQFDISSFAEGNYLLLGIDEAGKIIFTKKLAKNKI